MNLNEIVTLLQLQGGVKLVSVRFTNDTEGLMVDTAEEGDTE